MASLDILIVDSDPTFRAMVRDLLVREGVGVRTATETSEGLQAIRDQAPDALLVSLDLGQENTRALVEAAKDSGSRPSIPVILLSGEQAAPGDAPQGPDLWGGECVRLDKTDPEALCDDIRLIIPRTPPLAQPVRPPAFSPAAPAGNRNQPVPLEAFDRLGEGVVLVDNNLLVGYANPAAARLLGKGSSDLIGRPLEAHFSPSSREQVHATLAGWAFQEPEEAVPVLTVEGRILTLRLLSLLPSQESTRETSLFLLEERAHEEEAPPGTGSKEQELSLLSEILVRARSPLPEEAIFPFLLEKCIEIADAEAGTVALLETENGKTGHLAFRYTLGEQAESIRGIYIPMGQGVIGWCVSNDETVIVNDVHNDPRFFPWVDQMSGFKTSSILCLPVHSEGNVFGAVEVVNKRTGGFTWKDAERLNTLVDAATFNMETAMIQRRLLSQRDYYSGIMDSLSEGVLVLKRDHRIADVNQFFVMFLNRERNEIIGDTCHRVLKNQDTPCKDCFLLRSCLFEEGKDCATTASLKTPEGENAQFRVAGTPLEVRDEIIDSAILTFHDVTRIQRLHDYLHASASVASLLLKGHGIRGLVGETLEIMGRAAGASRCYWYENRQDEQGGTSMVLQAEWSSPETVSLRDGRAPREVPYAEGFGRWLEAFSRGHIIEGKVAAFPPEERRGLEDRDVQAVLLIPLFVRERLQGFIGFDNCSTAHPWQEAEINLLQTTANLLSKAFEHDLSLKALRDSEARYRDIYENIYDSWYLHDMDGRFLEVNPAVERSAGYPAEELLHMGLRDLIPSKYHYQFDRYLRDLREKGVAEGLTRIRTKNGEERIMEYRNWIVQQPDGSPASRGIVRDVTERMNLKSQLKHAQRMESIGTIATGISHNFRNLLAGIMTNCQLIHMKFRHIPEVDRYANEILKLTRAGSDLIKNLLQFSRKGPSESKTVINLSEVLSETHNIISRSFDKRFDIQTRWPEVLPVYAEPSSLSQVFLNLYTNARDAMPDGGTLTIEAERNDARIVVTIRDTGVGMDPATQEKVYDPFYTTKKPGEGTGLGLSTAYGIVKQHGGDIQFDTEPGLGTTFRVLLPVPEPTTRQGEEASPIRLVRGQGQKVLVVDDDETILQPMIELLEGLEYQASAVSNGRQAIEAHMSWRPDVILLDRSMPGMDGLETAERILESDPDAWIILISGYDEDGPDGIDRQVRDSIKGYIPKPFDIGEVSKILAKVLKT